VSTALAHVEEQEQRRVRKRQEVQGARRVSVCKVCITPEFSIRIAVLTASAPVFFGLLLVNTVQYFKQPRTSAGRMLLFSD
jgi:hypothetical protein